MHVSPSAVSQQLKKLEDEIKVPLFTRLHRGLIPTKEGRQLYDVLKVFMEELESTVSKLKESKTIPSGLLRIGAPLEFGSITLPKIIATYRHVYPQVKFNIRIGHSDELLPMLAEGALDFAFVDTFPTKDRKKSFIY